MTGGDVDQKGDSVEELASNIEVKITEQDFDKGKLNGKDDMEAGLNYQVEECATSSAEISNTGSSLDFLLLAAEAARLNPAPMPQLLINESPGKFFIDYIYCN